MSFTIQHKDNTSHARTGIMHLPHGDVQTPAFMPVGTNATVKAMRVEDIKEMGVNLILSNSYHLYLRPGLEVIRNAGGLHKFMNWNDNILTDSGGFQVFSLAPFRKITEEGVQFRSHIDGSLHDLTPEKVVEIQSVLGSDIQMPLDVCTPTGISHKEALEASDRTTLWAERSIRHWRNLDPSYQGLLFAIVQGNFFKDLRSKSAAELVAMDFPGYAIGGLSVGEAPEEFSDFLSHTAVLLPEQKTRYLMGIGTPEYILEAVENGIDIFDCVFPTRTARNAMVFTYNGTHSLRLEQNKLDNNPIDSSCLCYTCRNYSRSYLRHLFKANEILAAMLATYHNLFFIHRLILDIRSAISEDRFSSFKKDFMASYIKKKQDRVQ